MFDPGNAHTRFIPTFTEDRILQPSLHPAIVCAKTLALKNCGGATFTKGAAGAGSVSFMPQVPPKGTAGA